MGCVMAKENKVKYPTAEEIKALESAKPCPFCGSVGEGLSDGTVHFEDKVEAFVECLNCNAYGPSRDSLGEAVLAWDQRAQ